MKNATTQDANKTNAAVIALAARVTAFAHIEDRAFHRARALEELHAPYAPAMPGIEQGEAAFAEWGTAVQRFERESGIAEAGRLFDRTMGRTGAAAVELAAAPAHSVETLLAKARAAELAGRDRDQVEWVVALRLSVADDVLALAAVGDLDLRPRHETPFLTENEAADWLRCSKSKIKMLRRSGKLAFTPGRPVLILKTDLDEYLQGGKQQASEEPAAAAMEAAKAERQQALEQVRARAQKKYIRRLARAKQV